MRVWTGRKTATTSPYRPWAECRESCRRRLEGRPLPWIVEKLGGVEDTVTDSFGFQYSLCGPGGGFTSVGRAEMLTVMGENCDQPDWVPPFTRVGFWKTRVPPGLWRQLSQEYRRVQSSIEEEECHPGLINCQQIQDDGEHSFLRNIPRSLMMWLSEEMEDSLRRELQPVARVLVWTETGALGHVRSQEIHQQLVACCACRHAQHSRHRSNHPM